MFEVHNKKIKLLRLREKLKQQFFIILKQRKFLTVKSKSKILIKQQHKFNSF